MKKPAPPEFEFGLFLSNLSLIYEGAIGQPKKTTSLCHSPDSIGPLFQKNLRENQDLDIKEKFI